MQIRNLKTALGVGSLLLLSATTSPAATFTLYSDSTAFSSAVGGSLVSQDFEGFAPGTDLSGVEFLAGVSATTNLEGLEAFGSGGNIVMFALGDRASGDTRYDVAISLPYLAVGFDIMAFEDDPNEPTTAAGPGTLEFTFADATSFATDIFGNPAGDPIFVGITSDTAITGIRWSEPLEKGGAGNEETSLDNFSVSRVPEPGLTLSLGAGLAGIAASRRRPPA
jgi:hypothetical protein